MIVTTDAARLTGTACGGSAGAGCGAAWPVSSDPLEPVLLLTPLDLADGCAGGNWVDALLASGTRATAAGNVCGTDVAVPPDPLVGGWLPEPGRARVAMIWPSCPPLPGITCIAPACIMGVIITQLKVKSI